MKTLDLIMIRGRRSPHNKYNTVLERALSEMESGSRLTAKTNNKATPQGAIVRKAPVGCNAVQRPTGVNLQVVKGGRS